MEQKQYDELVEKLGKEAADRIQKHADEIEKKLIKLAEERTKGMLTNEQFEAFKSESLAEVNEQLKKLENIAKEQGESMAKILANNPAAPKVKSLEDFIKDKAEQLKNFKKAGTGNIEISLKDAGVISIGANIAAMDAPPNSPYAPGIGGGVLELFDIRRNPNFIMNYVDLGRTDSYRLAWINERPGEGAAAAVSEGNPKPLIDKDFKVELSTAKKIAGMVKITEEFEQDLPGLATQVRRMLYDDVVRAFDDAITTAVIAAAPGYTITSLDDKVAKPNLWDAIRAGIAQVAKANYTPNFIGVNPATVALMEMTKNDNGTYAVPPFAGKVNDKLKEANKVAEGYALIGDINQYKVDIYKDFVLKLGWNNDDFQRNQFSIVGEVRYHDYISDNRKAALTYFQLSTVVDQINSEA